MWKTKLCRHYVAIYIFYRSPENPINKHKQTVKATQKGSSWFSYFSHLSFIVSIGFCMFIISLMTLNIKNKFFILFSSSPRFTDCDCGQCGSIVSGKQFQFMDEQWEIIFTYFNWIAVAKILFTLLKEVMAWAMLFPRNCKATLPLFYIFHAFIMFFFHHHTKYYQKGSICKYVFVFTVKCTIV